MISNIFNLLVKFFKLILTFQTVMCTRLLVGLFYSVSDNTTIRIFARLYCLCCFALVLRCSIERTIEDGIYFTGLSSLFSYTITVIINLIYSGELIHNFVDKIKRIDDLLEVKMRDEIPLTRIVFVFVIMSKALTSIGLYNTQKFETVDFITYNLFSFGISLSNLTRIMLFESVCLRMKLLRKRFKLGLSATRRFEDGEAVLIENLNNCLIIYKNIVITIKETEIPMKSLVSRYNQKKYVRKCIVMNVAYHY